MREITVWRIFECLIDGLSALHFGNELTLVAPGNIYQSRTLPGWDPIIHFDLKPGNSESLKHFCNLGLHTYAEMAVLMAEDRSIHGASPVVKVSNDSCVIAGQKMTSITDCRFWSMQGYEHVYQLG
jgi:hypothetical protein